MRWDVTLSGFLLCVLRDSELSGKSWLYHELSQFKQALDPSVRCSSGGISKLVPL